VFIVLAVYFVIDSVRKLLDTPSCYLFFQFLYYGAQIVQISIIIDTAYTTQVVTQTLLKTRNSKVTKVCDF